MANDRPPARRERREGWTVDMQVSALNDDIDDLVAVAERLDAKSSRTNTILSGMLVSLAVASVMLALNLIK